MSKSEPNKLDTLDDILESLEALRSQVVDLEAMAHAAAQTLEYIPYVPRANQSGEPDKAPDKSPGKPPKKSIEIGPDTRLQLNRLQALVAATAEAAFSVLTAVEDLLDRAQKRPSQGGGSNGHGGSQAREPRAVYRATAPDLRLVV